MTGCLFKKNVLFVIDYVSMSGLNHTFFFLCDAFMDMFAGQVQDEVTNQTMTKHQISLKMMILTM